MQDTMTFSILGLTADTQSVTGHFHAGGKHRLMAITLNEDPDRRKKHNDLVRREIETSVLSLQGAPIPMREKFNLASAKDIRARIDMPAYADDTLTLLATEDKVPEIVILDCASRAAFWSALKALNVSDAMMLQLSAISSYKPQHSRENTVKPRGNAHILCQELQKRRFEQSAINDIAESQKFRLPDLDWWAHWEAARFESNLKSIRKSGRRQHMKWVARAVTGTATLLNRVFNMHLPQTPQELQKYKEKLDAKNAEFLANMNDDENLRVSGHQQAWMDREEGIKAFLKHWGLKNMEEAESRYSDDGYIYLDWMMVPRMRIRDGLHFLPFDKCLFEFDTLYNQDRSNERTFVLATKVGDDVIQMEVFSQDHDNPHPRRSRIETRIQLSKNRFQIINTTHMDKGKSVTSTAPGASIHLQYIAHVLNALTRINAPGYEDHLVVPKQNRVMVGKHAYPYFEYRDLVLDNTRADYITIGAGGDIAGVQKRRHIVRGHPRRYRDSDGYVIDVTVIPPHMRGNAELGFVSKSYVVK